jgi:hypothetical protein
VSLPSLAWASPSGSCAPVQAAAVGSPVAAASKAWNAGEGVEAYRTAHWRCWNLCPRVARALLMREMDNDRQPTYRRLLELLGDHEWHPRAEVEELTEHPALWIDELEAGVTASSRTAFSSVSLGTSSAAESAAYARLAQARLCGPRPMAPGALAGWTEAVYRSATHGAGRRF